MTGTPIMAGVRSGSGTRKWPSAEAAWDGCRDGLCACIAGPYRGAVAPAMPGYSPRYSRIGITT